MKPILVAAVLALGLALAPPVSGQGEGGKRPKIKILGVSGKLNFEIRPRESCDFFAIETIRIRFRGHGFKKTFVLDEPCGEWTAGSKSAPSLRFTREDGTGYRAGRLKLKAVGDEEVERRYKYDIRMDGKLSERGAVRVDVREGDDGGVERYVYVED